MFMISLLRYATLVIACLTTACASLPPPGPRVSEQAISASPQTELGRIALSVKTGAADRSAVRPLPQGGFALDARLELIRRAQASLDVQSYHLAPDKTGLLILRELRDAARRGVRVRLLLDDFHTMGLDRALLALNAEAGAEVRLFNPFASGREHTATRWLAFFSDFGRLNHRMHNKLLVADGAIAIAGGRNMADEYFMRSDGANFLDFELLMAGPVVPQSARIFDEYWNSDVVYPLTQVVHSPDAAETLKSEFELASSEARAPRPDTPPDADAFGEPPLGKELARGELRWMQAEADAFADSPNKALGTRPAGMVTLAQRWYTTMEAAKSQLLVISPYFIPGDKGMERIRAARARGLPITIITNSLADTDEPLVNVNYNSYRVALLQAGVELFEVSSRQMKRNKLMRRALRNAQGRLHGKLALIDREWVLLGSMNLDPRSALLNTEFGVRVRSFELTHALHDAYLLDNVEGVYRVKLGPDGQGVQWVGTGDESNEVLDDEPDSSMLTRLQLLMFSWFVPSDQL
jgi:putative cardiolipin synthase